MYSPHTARRAVFFYISKMNHELPESPEPDTESPPRVPVKIEEFCAALAMALICCITFANVVVRYFTDASFAFTEEFSIFLMVVLTLFGASAAFVRNQHIRMTFLTERLPQGVAHKVECLVMVLSAVMFGVLAWYGCFLFWDDWQYGTTSPGIGIPQWIYTIWLPLLSALIFLRIVGRVVRLLRAPAQRSQS
jgi:TRAP-type C4-dicarboxylate transport system permease small subunit